MRTPRSMSKLRGIIDNQCLIISQLALPQARYCHEDCRSADSGPHGLWCQLYENIPPGLFGRLGETANVLQLLAHLGVRKTLELHEYTKRNTKENEGADKRIKLECAKYFKATTSTSKDPFNFDAQELSDFRALMLSPMNLSDRHVLNIHLKSIHSVYIVQLLENTQFFQQVKNAHYNTCRSLIGALILELMFRLENSLTPIILEKDQLGSGYYSIFDRIDREFAYNTYHAYHKGRLYVFANKEIQTGTVLTRKACEVSDEKYGYLSPAAKDLYQWTEHLNYACWELRRVRERRVEERSNQSTQKWEIVS